MTVVWQLARATASRIDDERTLARRTAWQGQAPDDTHAPSAEGKPTMRKALTQSVLLATKELIYTKLSNFAR